MMLEMGKHINITFTESDQPIFPSLYKNFTCIFRGHAKLLLIMQFLRTDFFYSSFLHVLYRELLYGQNYAKLILAISQRLVVIWYNKEYVT